MSAFVSVIPRPRSIKSLSFPREEIKITVELLRPLFSTRQEHAAESLGISLTTLKAACRQLGIIRWPYTRKKSQRVPVSHSQAGSSIDAKIREHHVLAESSQGVSAQKVDAPAWASERSGHEHGIYFAEPAASSGCSSILSMHEAEASSAAPFVDTEEHSHSNHPEASQYHMGPCCEHTRPLKNSWGNDTQERRVYEADTSLVWSDEPGWLASQDIMGAAGPHAELTEDAGGQHPRGIDRDWLAWFLRTSDESGDVTSDWMYGQA
ncbi:hypothetical protein GUITHDRAFT_113332 [Guillardia theta CCMP2712]|uniref:RWP-RK domain-containing protein n=1 Tax=Guillardia theta (strain CCMP2712) TaxID=905079 RepID=L1IWD3_GUITC|nr:hypothetical protein GUITHDRAFT_113332 [Guillardia theta CCMP2712]EKX40546.1 hypothetical protein GUITHDRAFT_113332 [Guillardia theta CCMP2712]|eukprot:XP_005827526.1 hypothetical protein GUITHDRAFT_113332 [Guillardia theta CCMP2712]